MRRTPNLSASSSVLALGRPSKRRAARLVQSQRSPHQSTAAAYSTLPPFLVPAWTSSSSSWQQSHPSSNFASSSAPVPSSSIPSSSRATSSLSSFFDRKSSIARPPSVFSQPQRSLDAIASFREAISTKYVPTINATYNELVAAHQAHQHYLHDVVKRWQVDFPARTSEHSFKIRKADLQEAMRVVLRARVPGQPRRPLCEEDAQFLRRIYDDLKDVFGLERGPTDFYHLLWTYCREDPKSRFYKDPVLAFEEIRAANPTWATSSVDWNLVLTALSKRGESQRAQALWRSMESDGINPERTARNTMISLYFASGMIEEAEKELRALGPRDEMWLDTLTIALDGYTTAIRSCSDETLRAHFVKMARRYAQVLREGAEPSELTSGRRLDRAAWFSVFRYEALLMGPQMALESARKAYRPDIFKDRIVTNLLLLHEQELVELQTSDEALGLLRRIESIDRSKRLKASQVPYSILILALLGRPPTQKMWAAATSSEQAEDAVRAAAALDDIGMVSGINKTPTPNQIREAQLLYDAAIEHGVEPDASMVGPLIWAYCDASFLPSLASAIKLMDDLIRALESERQDWKDSLVRGKRFSYRSKRHPSSRVMIDPGLFSMLLRGCAKIKDVGTARALLKQMTARGVRIDQQSKVNAASILMRISSSWEEAFSVYREVGKLETGAFGAPADARVSETGYDAKAYVSLLDVFRKLELPDGASDDMLSGDKGAQGHGTGTAPPEYLLSILHDMQEAGHQPTAALYTSLLDYYGKSHMPSFAGVWSTHELIKQDTELEPDLPLINALMNAYNRAGAPGPVFSIWESLMVHRQEVDGGTMAILLDTAGRHGMLGLARKAVAAIQRQQRSAMNKSAWDAWVECLARCDRLEEAVEVVFGTMTKQLVRDAIENNAPDPPSLSSAPGEPIRDQCGRIIGPDSKTLQTLLKFAARDRDLARRHGRTSSTWHLVRTRVQDEMPWLWEDVKHIGTGSGTGTGTRKL